jgi:hypothetical protein
MLYPVTGQVGRARGSHGNQCGVSENGSWKLTSTFIDDNSCIRLLRSGTKLSSA